MEHKLSVYNTLSRKKELFKPINSPHVGLYVCGPTVYSDVHLGNVRTFTSFDIIYRYLVHLGYKVRYVRNITDVGHLVDDIDEGEDKIAKKARLENLEPMEVVQRYTNGFHDVMKMFNNLSPSIEPTATGHIMEQIEMIEKIMENGFAYEVNGSVYFDVIKYSETENYGELSGRKIDELLSNSRALDGQSDKKNQVDFALWKKADEQHLMRWNSPWSVGFPGWHLECSVMSTKYLGENFDIHGGGMDLKFPHHECEIAQNKATNKNNPVNYWLHTNMLTVNGRKMAKSEGNGFTPEQLVTGDHQLLEQGYSPMTVRFFMLQSHYSSTLDFSNEALKAAEKGYKRLVEAMNLLGTLDVSEASDFDVQSFSERCYAAMNDDFNTPILLSVMFEGVKFINRVKAGEGKISATDKEKLTSLFSDLAFDVLGFRKETEQTADLSEGLMSLILDIRKEAKANKDYARCDAIRDQLKALNISVKDSREGSTWEME